jgi:phosphate starvation-inducible PhoH-like protein
MSADTLEGVPETERTVLFQNETELREILGAGDQILKQLCQELRIRAVCRERFIKLFGPPSRVERAEGVIETLRRRFRSGTPIRPEEVGPLLQDPPPPEATDQPIRLFHGKRTVIPRTEGQRRYVQMIQEHDIVFCNGPAGTGKTYLAVAMALNALDENRVRRVLLTRPAVEAGESLGFLPGDLQQKVNPYIQPLYDALGHLTEPGMIPKWIERGVLEVIPIAFMRGRTLDHSYVILDEAQNTTVGQMKMFLTRLGQGSRATITGDVTQTDLPPGQTSGMIHALALLEGIRGIARVELTESDIVRHPLVKRIVEAYSREPPPSPETPA